MVSDNGANADLRNNASAAEAVQRGHIPLSGAAADICGKATDNKNRNGVIVVKIGTSSVMRERGNVDASVSSAAAAGLPARGAELALSTIALVVDTLVALRRAGSRVVLVSSGAVGVGCRELGVLERPTVRSGEGADAAARVMSNIQAYAAVGQSVLMRTYADMLRLADQTVAQVLLTTQDLGSEYQYENAKNTLKTLLDMGVIPIVNENDTVATEELRYGDNDWMSALVSTAVSADWLFLLTDVDMLYTSNPRNDPNARGIPVVEDLEALAVDASQGANKTGTQWGTGGMSTKITAARLATAAGTRVALVHGRHPNRILDFVQGRPDAIGTVFEPRASPLVMQRKQWISQCLPPRGSICLHKAAVEALLTGLNNGSIMTAGVAEVTGLWSRNSAVRICDADGNEIGRGISGYGSGELNDFKGLEANAITRMLGTPTSAVVIHEHDLALFLSLPKPAQ